LLQKSPLEGAVWTCNLQYNLAHLQQFLDSIQYRLWRLTLTTSYKAILSDNSDINKELEEKTNMDKEGEGGTAPVAKL